MKDNFLIWMNTYTSPSPDLLHACSVGSLTLPKEEGVKGFRQTFEEVQAFVVKGSSLLQESMPLQSLR